MSTLTEEKHIGLTSAEAELRLAEQGENRFARKKKVSAARIFAGQFRDVMVMILLISAAVSVFVSGWQDALPIMIIVVMNAALGFFQEYRCEKTLERMEELAAPEARVRRDGELVTIPASQVVTGDVFEVEAGDRFPADCIILSQNRLACDESALTGETLPAEKTAWSGEEDRKSINLPYMGYMGTSAVRGSAVCEAAAVGTASQMGQVSGMLGGIENEQTPLQKKLGELGKVLALICLAVCVLVFAAGVIRGEAVGEMFFTAVSVAIAAIPEGLPAAVTIALALAVRRMLRQNALVHKLHSVETLGCANVICTDKTGTLTQNRMRVSRLCVLSDTLTEQDTSQSFTAWDGAALTEALICAAVCSNARRVHEPPTGERNRLRRPHFEGDPTEAALAELCASAGIERELLLYKRIDEKPFDSESKYMSVTCRSREGTAVFTKGAPEVLLKMCRSRRTQRGLEPLGEEQVSAVRSRCDELAAEGLRLIGLAETVGGQTVFLGFAALEDPLRPQAAEAVRECRRAGIATVMITGDHKLTASAAAKQAGILTPSKRVVTGEELDRMTDEQLAEEIENIAVFARVTPAHKLRIVRAFKSRGKVVAMTGDGVNDAPAVKEASIGVSMGISGSDVTKQAADTVLLDDNFATLVSAVREGRTIYANIRKFVRYLIACNIGEVLTMFGAMVIGMPIPLLPTQILLVNLVTDGLPAAALSAEPPERDIMRRPPRSADDSFFSGGLLGKMLIRGALIAAAALGCFSLLLPQGLAAARTGAMLTLVASQLIHVFECRSEDKPLFSIPLKGCLPAVGAVAVSAACTAVCCVLPKLADIFSLTMPDTKGLVICAVTALAAPMCSAVSGSISVVKTSRRSVSERV
ncbi:Ca2+-transporting ATPase [Ruminococcus sp. YE71]|uniref:cation-translocating P-type ATPase n=1 Tax=unclassified Ruminococcus TaxID=2608920 RepID=UPI000888C8DE|nr:MULTISPECIES: cation-translocating P-type ATPase [unclassified Ruminococcus]SDA15861.1 Ca2+-transporting ATPase [Ruminococcus sp. YE78]SFW23334.1 Ca2+-transporting ATPase [Ruminococcus sp. YE71]